jgi:hypothetical protein
VNRQNGHSRIDLSGPTNAAEAQDRILESGHLALLGHRILGAISVVAGACETLSREDCRISSADREGLEGAIERNLLEVADGARSLMRGDVTLP